MRVDWAAVPKAMRARRVNRELSLEREAGAAARADADALSGAREQRRRAERERQELEGAAVSERAGPERRVGRCVGSARTAAATAGRGGGGAEAAVTLSVWSIDDWQIGYLRPPYWRGGCP
jgi:hypothetical protein